MTHSPIQLTKASGELVPFSARKLSRSLRRAGADEPTIHRIMHQIETELQPGMSTQHIYQRAYALLKPPAGPAAARYKLKNAIMELGPSGYPFEKYIGELFKQQGFEVQVGITLKGCCVTHEIDVLARNDSILRLTECKFHNQVGFQSDVKIPLYVHSRFRDVEAVLRKDPSFQHQVEGWLVTNTRFTGDALKYGACAGMHLLSWDYPENDSLRQWVDHSGLYPITCLSQLNSQEKQLLLNNQVVMCQEIAQQPQLLYELGIPRQRVHNIRQEAAILAEGLADIE